jgi:ubiquinone/menaquinone biosynthesis C-methylase UbiE
MSRLDGFNRIAWAYESLKRLVFGQALLKSQLHFLHTIPPRATVLILGGGTGEILLPLIQGGLRQIYYVEASSEMLLRARERVQDVNQEIRFIHGTQEALPAGLTFNAIITNFFLDLFTDAGAASICRQLESVLRDDGMWFVSDFVKGGPWWQRTLLWAMYRFFNLTADVEGKSLPDWEGHLRQAGLVEVASHSYYSGFVKTGIYKKPQRTFYA